MGGLQTEVDPAEVGFDPARLDRIDRHFARYVDEQKLAGWLITVARHGKLAHVSAYGQRDIEAGLPVEADSLWRIYSMTKPVTSVAAMILYEEGGFELTDPVEPVHPLVPDVRVFAGGSDVELQTVPAAEPIRIWHLLTHTSGLTYGFMRTTRSTRSTGPAASSGARRAARTWPAAASFAAAAAVPAGHASGATRWRPTCSAAWSRWCPARAWTSSWPSRIFGPLGMTDTASGRTPTRPAGPALHARPRTARPCAWTPSASRLPAPRSSAAGAAGLLGRRLPPVHPDAAGPAGQPGGRTGWHRLLSPRTVAYMTRNHLPGGADLESFGRPLFAEALLRGAASAWVRGGPRPGRGQDAELGRGVQLGRRGQTVF